MTDSVETFQQRQQGVGVDVGVAAVEDVGDADVGVAGDNPQVPEEFFMAMNTILRTKQGESVVEREEAVAVPLAKRIRFFDTVAERFERTAALLVGYHRSSKTPEEHERLAQRRGRASKQTFNLRHIKAGSQGGASA